MEFDTPASAPISRSPPRKFKRLRKLADIKKNKSKKRKSKKRKSKSPPPPPRKLKRLRKLADIKKKKSKKRKSKKSKKNNPLFQTFKETGVVGIPIKAPGREAFITTLKQCCNTWFHEHLNNMLGKPGEALRAKTLANRKKTSASMAANDKKYNESKQAWLALTPKQREDVLVKLDLTTDKGHALVHSNAEKKKMFSKKKYGDFLIKSIRFALNGGNALNMGTLVTASWSQSGFGIFSSILTGYALEHVFHVQQAIKDVFDAEVFINGLPAIIYKPVNGSKLNTHHDNYRSYKMYAELLSSVQNNETNVDWMRKHGIQTLSHIDGGALRNGKPTGNTFTVGPTSPYRMLLTLSLIHPKHTHSGMSDVSKTFWSHDVFGGPVFYAHENNLVVVNRVLKHFNGSTKTTNATDLAWLKKFKTTPAYKALTETTLVDSGKPIKQSPIANSVTKTDSSYLATWLINSWHGSYNNKNDARISSIPVFQGSGPASAAKSKYWLDRIEHLAKFCHGTATESEASLKWLKKHNKPLQGGATHSKPNMQMQLMGKGKAFHKLAPTIAQARTFRKRVEKEQQTGKPWVYQNTQAHGAPISVVDSFDDSDDAGGIVEVNDDDEFDEDDVTALKRYL